ncbi:LLM class flavin-dependent oxidoreductase [Occultella glacieicola]|uniref:LLM class flavin-dependent oxidoreductase n=1 Tax=Occultella glacieicola TaxID=2518684 RepID=A0ABY2E3V0_9MICO|nr:LLM class flavin-dependent oxidoreductase [Occultella glacieicola]TDE89694.1 LLM class flavin-dependent oxidoreductase [Occultella glacieicola]
MSKSPRTPSTTSLIALDLSGAGAPREWRRTEDSEAESFIMGRLAGLASLADKGGVDLLTLDETFRVGGPRRRDAWLDGAVAASRLARHTRTATLVAAVPLGASRPEHVAGAVSSVHRASAERAGWQLETAPVNGTSARAVDAVINSWVTPQRDTRSGSARSSGAAESGRRAPIVVIPVRNAVDLELAAARADVARLSVATLEEARTARTAIRNAAAEWGRNPDDVRVVIDVHVVISADRPSARARWDLLNSLETAPRTAPLRSIGTAADLVDLWAEWVHAGAADGFTVIPASVPTDVLALVQDVVPALAARGLRTGGSAPATTGAPAAGTASRAARSTRLRTAAEA